MLMRCLRKYGEIVKKRPVVCQIATSGIVTSAGDVVAQKLESSNSFNFRRTAVMSSMGFCFFGPFVSGWLILLKKLNMRLFFTIACDQAIVAPFLTSGFVFLHPILSGKTIEEAKTIYKTKWWDIMKKGWTVWIPAQTINFAFVPFEFRMLFVQCISLMWNAFLSHRSNATLNKQ